MSDTEKQRPNSGRPFLPGQSGNPGGRPKGPSLLSFLRTAGQEMEGDKPKLQKVADKAFELAMDGDIRAIQFIADRVDGKVAQNIVLEEAPRPKLADVQAVVRQRHGRKRDGAEPF